MELCVEPGLSAVSKNNLFRAVCLHMKQYYTSPRTDTPSLTFIVG